MSLESLKGVEFALREFLLLFGELEAAWLRSRSSNKRWRSPGSF